MSNNKYLVVFDLETTGTDKKKDHIIQFAGLKIDKATKKIVDTKNIHIQPSGDYHMSIQAYMKHGLLPKDLLDKPFLKDVAQEIVDFFDDSDVLTYNGNNFDIPMLKKELNDIGYNVDFLNRDIYDAYLEERERHGMTLGDVYKRYKGMSMDEAGLQAHDALSDVKATYTIYFAQNKQKEVKPTTILVEENIITLQEFRGKLVPCFNIGKYKMLSLDFVWSFDTEYFNWCISDKCEFSKLTKNYIKNYINSKI